MSWPVRASQRLYGMLLAVFPRRFRERFGAEITETFTQLAEETYAEAGGRGLAGLWIKTLADIGRHGGGERIGNDALRADQGSSTGAGNRPGRPRPRRGGRFDTLRQDLAFALRGVRRDPMFSVAIIATIGLGIGANTAIFTVVNGILLEPLPFAGSERVVQLCETNERVGDYCIVSPPNLQDWQRMSSTIEAFGLARNHSFILEQPEGGRTLRAGVATPGWFTVHGIEAEEGRLLTEADMLEGDNRVVVLSHRLWQSDFGADPAVIGSALILDGRPYTVIGVLPPDPWMYEFGFADIWTPITTMEDDVTKRDWRGFTGLGKLADGVTLSAARDEMEGIRAALERDYPESNRGWGLQIDLLRDRVAGPVHGTLLLFLGAVGLVLLIACANVANLLLVRSTARAQEFAVRASLGAGRGRLARQLLTESFVLAALGGAAGVLLAVWTTRVFLRLAPQNIPRLDEVGVDGNVLLFALLVTALTAVLFGLAPAVSVARGELAESLRARRSLDGRGNGVRKVLVVAEMALAVMLLVGAGLLLRGFLTLTDWDPGFDRDNLVTVFAIAPTATYETGDEAVALFERAADEVRALPQVAAVGLTSSGPLFGGRETTQFDIASRPSASPDERPSVRYYDIGTEYFDTLGIAIVRGRDFEPSDRNGSLPVAMINETFARRFLADEDPLGQTIEIFGGPRQIVGVVADVRPFQPDEAVGAEVYVPKRQFRRWGAYLVIRTRGNADNLADAVRQRFHALDPDFNPGGFVTLDEIAGRMLVSPRFNMLLIGLFSSVALALAAIGTYGVIAFAVSRRTHEIGIRMALGARPANVRLSVIGSGMRLALIGLVGGIGGALLLSRLIGGFTYGIPPSDPLTLAAVIVLFGVVALLACWLPARRASKLDPLDALRSE
ncbi:MAG: ABC transporter permease [Acidobacteriota bacterium]